MISKNEILNFIKNNSSFESIIESCQINPNEYGIKFFKSKANLEFDNDFSKWSYANIKNDDRFFIYAKVGIIHHKKFDREFGFAFILENKNEIKYIHGFLVQNIKSKLYLTQMNDN